MEKKFENGCCITAVMRPKSGAVVTCSGSHTDLFHTFGIMCYEFMKTEKLTYEEMRAALIGAVLLKSTLS